VEDGTGNGLSAAAKAKQASGMSDNADREMTFPMFKKAMRTIADLLDIEVDENDFFGKQPSGGGNDDGGNSNAGMASSVASLSGAKPAASPKKLAKLEGTSKSLAGSLASVEEEGSRVTPSKSGKTKKGKKGDATSPSGHDKRPWGGGPGPGIDTSLWGYVPKDKDVKRPWQEQREQVRINHGNAPAIHTFPVHWVGFDHRFHDDMKIHLPLDVPRCEPRPEANRSSLSS
jgi:hypothetical protein